MRVLHSILFNSSQEDDIEEDHATIHESEEPIETLLQARIDEFMKGLENGD